MNSDRASFISASIADQTATGGPTESPLRVSKEHAERMALLFHEEHRKLVGYLLRRTRSSAEAWDIASRAFSQLLFMKDPGAVNCFKAYLYIAARNITINCRVLGMGRTRIDGIARHEFTSTSPSPEPLLFEEERLQVLQRVVAALRPLWREAVLMRFWDHLEYQEIAERFAQKGISVTDRTVRRWVKEAIAECRRQIRSAEGEGDR